MIEYTNEHGESVTLTEDKVITVALSEKQKLPSRELPVIVETWMRRAISGQIMFFHPGRKLQKL